jgi:hypothetical protein
MRTLTFEHRQWGSKFELKVINVQVYRIYYMCVTFIMMRFIASVALLGRCKLIQASVI